MANTSGNNHLRKVSKKKVSAAGAVSNTGLRRLIGLSSDSWLSPFVEDHLVKSREPRYDKGWFHPSELSNECDRRLAFSFLGIKRQDAVIKGRTMRIFHNGDMVHRRWQAYFKAMGILIKKEAPFEIQSPPVRGRADAIISHPISHDPSIVEIKSINDNGFSRLDAPRDDHFNQLNIYMAGHGIEEGLVLYENKNDQHTKYFPVKHDKTRWDQLQFRLLKIMRRVLKGELPDIYNHDGCKTCPFLYFCFSAGSDAGKVVKNYGSN